MASVSELDNASASLETKLRIQALDVIRGVSILGILAVNADGFASPMSGSLHPATWPFPNEGLTAILYWIVDAFFHEKFVTLFSMLFGISMFLVGGERSDLHKGRILRRRLLVLLLFSMLHGFGIWWGDVLSLYACTGFVMFFCRSWRPKTLMIVGLLLYSVFACARLPTAALPFGSTEARAQALSKLSPDHTALTKSRQKVAAEIVEARSSWAGAYRINAREYLHLLSGDAWIVPSTLSLMMVGLSLFKMGFLKGQSTPSTYLSVTAMGAVALSIGATLAWQKDICEVPLLISIVAQQLLAPFVSLAYASLLILALRAGAASAMAPFAAVGRMAFTNYLTQSLIMTTIFYGGRGGLIGAVDRPALAVIVVAVWAIQLTWSTWWLKKFDMGPFEWLWRCLTYGRLVPLLRK